METDRNLLFGVLALQGGLIDNDKFAEACSAWTARKHQPLAELLVERGWLTPEDRRVVEYLSDKTLKKHSGDARASLAAVCMEESRRSIADVPLSTPHVGSSTPGSAKDLVSTIGAEVECRDRYTLTHLHASGGIGRVWLAQDTDLNRNVALKELRPDRADNDRVRARFLKEARITGQLEHPGIVPVYELGRRFSDSQPFYTMRFVRGETLSKAVKRYDENRKRNRTGPLDQRRLLNAFVSVCQAVAYAHSRGVVHRDLKGQNVVLGEYGEVILLDWGLAKLLDQRDADADEPPIELTVEPADSHTIQGQVIGTPAYMAPEQAAGRPDQVSPRTDIYGLGAILYEILGGQPPFSGGDTQDVLQRVQSEPPPRLATLDPDVSPALEAVCLKAMAKKPADRYATATELAEEVQHWLADEPVKAYPEPWTVRLRRWVGRHRVLVTGTAAAAVVASLCLGLAAALLSVARDAEREAREAAQKQEEVAKQQRERAVNQEAIAQQQRELAEKHFDLAGNAVDKYYTKISENRLMKEPGFQGLRRDLLQTALQYYDKLARDRSDDPRVRPARAKTLGRLSLVHRDLGAHEQAVQCAKEALAEQEQILAGDATNRTYLHDLLATRVNLASTYRDLGRLQDARAILGQAIDIIPHLGEEKLEGVSTRYDLAVCCYNLGKLQYLMGELKPAVASFTKTRQLVKELLTETPANQDYRRLHAVNLNSLGYVYIGLSEMQTAEKLFRETLDVHEQLAAENPRDPEPQSDLGSALLNIGKLHDATGRTSLAEQEWLRAASIFEKLSSENPVIGGYRHGWALALHNLGAVYGQSNRLDKCKEALLKAMQLRAALAKDQPNVVEFRADLAASHFSLGNLSYLQKDLDAAEAAYGLAADIQRLIVERHPANYEHARALAFTYSNLSIVHMDRKQLDAAEKTLRAWQEVQEQMVKAHPTLPGLAAELADLRSRLAGVLEARGQMEAALAGHSEAVQSLENLVRDHPMIVQFRQNLAYVLDRRARLLGNLHRSADALRDWDRVLEVSTGQHLADSRVNRLLHIAEMGQHRQGAEELEKLAAAPTRKPEHIIAFAQILSLCAAAAKKDDTLDAQARQERCDAYCRRAVELLRAGRKHVQNPAALRMLESHPTLDQLRSHEDFKPLLRELKELPP
jgi:serine/threonine-protein kinase